VTASGSNGWSTASSSCPACRFHWPISRSARWTATEHPGRARCRSQPQALVGGLPNLAFLRPYVAEEALSGWFDDFGHSGIVDANGGLGRISTTFNLFSLSGPGGTPNLLAPPLTPPQVQAALSINNLNRCPGSNERNNGDNSTPFTDNGTLACNPSEVPQGP